MRDYTQGGSPKLSRLRGLNFSQVGHALVYASLGLGLMEVLMPKRIQKMIGIRKGNYTGLIRFLGLREITSAMLIFMDPRPNMGVLSRVLGDAMDLGLLGAAFTLPKAKKNKVGIAAASIAGITALDALTAAQLHKQRKEAKQYSTMTQSELDGRASDGSYHIMRSITINRSPEELYRFWRNFENLPQFMIHLQSVKVLDDRRSHWITKGPAGTQVSWDAVITEDRPNEMIAWQSIGDTIVSNLGTVRFEPRPAGRGTVVRVEINFRPPGGAAGRIAAMMFGEDPTQQVMGDLGRFKEVMETGEILRSDGSPMGLGQKIQRPAQPLPDKKFEDIVQPELYQAEIRQ